MFWMFQLMNIVALGVVILLSIRPDILRISQVHMSITGPNNDGIYLDDAHSGFRASQELDQRKAYKGYEDKTFLIIILLFLFMLFGTAAMSKQY